jgi:hypothetical protein
MWAFLKSCCDASHYKIILQKLEDIYERIELLFDGVDLGKFIANINIIAQHLVEQRGHIAVGNATIPVADTSVADTSVADTPVADTSVANTPVADTSVVDTSVVDTSVADTPVANTSVADTSVATSTIKQFLADKEPLVKMAIREYMLKNFNITALDDTLEGEMYDYLIGTVWDLTVDTMLE